MIQDGKICMIWKKRNQEIPVLQHFQEVFHSMRVNTRKVRQMGNKVLRTVMDQRFFLLSLLHWKPALRLPAVA